MSSYWPLFRAVMCLLGTGFCISGEESISGSPWFVDQAAPAGLDFVHFNGMSGEFYIVEEMGAGVAFFDFDGDGDLDVFLVQGAMLGPQKTAKDMLFPFKGKGLPRDRLYRNDLNRPGGDPRFQDVTQASGIVSEGYGMGVAVGDVDNDGHADLYIAQFGKNRLWRNLGDGRFSEITEASGTGDPGWGVSASFVDIDHDGWLDLYVTNYLGFSFANHRVCRLPNGAPDYCGPKSFPDAPDRLFRNRGGGVFEDVTHVLGAAVKFGSGLGVVARDGNGDTWPDLYVANDADPNLWFLNQGKGQFREEGLFAGCALNGEGKAEAGMGVDAADYDGDGDEDLFVTNITGESHTLYRNEGDGLFEDVTALAGLHGNTLKATGFGAAWFDYDNDGRLDLLVVNGLVQSDAALSAMGDPFPLHQTNQLFRNLDGRRFEEVTARAGPVFGLSEVSRGAAFGDVDNDGDTDVLITNNNGPPRLLGNQVGNRNSWLGLRLVLANGRDALGAKVGLERGGQPTLWRWVRTDGSYASAHDPRILFGLGPHGTGGKVRVIWPEGDTEMWADLRPGRYHVLTRGKGRRP